MTATDPHLTAEGTQEMAPRDMAGGVEVLRELGSVLRLSEAEVAAMGDVEDDPDEATTTIMNMGPQHPSTHGVLRVVLRVAQDLRGGADQPPGQLAGVDEQAGPVHLEQRPPPGL